MRLQAERTVLLTGASGGLGTHMTCAFAARRTNLILVAHPGMELENLCREVEARGSRAISFSFDLREPALRRQLLREVTERFGAIDLLINNAGVEYTAAYHDLSEESILEVVSVNLEAPMILTRLFLPGMLQRKRGHIVNISSLAAKSGPAFQEPYAATKAALLAFTASLRATYQGSGVSASAIVPGFVEAGIYTKLKQQSGMAAPRWLGVSTPEKVAAAVIRAVDRDLPEVIVNPIPVRPLLAFTALWPRMGEWLSGRMGANDFFRRVVDAQKRKEP